MPIIIPGFDTQHRVSIVANDQTGINNEIATQAEDGWLVVSVTLSGSDVIILFTRNFPIAT